MDFVQLQDAVMSDRFDESQRGDVKNWINSAYWQIWVAEEWEFRYATKSVTVTSGSQTVTALPTDLGPTRSLSRSDGQKLVSLPLVEFERLYFNNDNPETGAPEAYTVLDGSMLVGPTSNVTATDYLLVYEREYTALSLDGDTPLTPQGADFALVFGAAQIGLKIQNDFTWQFFAQDFQAQLDALRRGYLADRRDSYPQFAADPIGYIY